MLLKRWSSLPPLQRPDAGSESFGSVTNIISQPLTLRSERQEHRNSAACFSTPYTQYIVQCQWKNPALLCLCLCLWECVCVSICAFLIPFRPSTVTWRVVCVLWPATAESSIWGVSCFRWRRWLRALWYGGQAEMWEQRTVQQHTQTRNTHNIRKC